MRLFAGIPLHPSVSERLANLRLRLSAPGDGLRWSAPEQWHVTLQFYGEVSDERAACLIRVLSGICVPAPELVLKSLDSFQAKGILHASVALTSSLQVLQEQVVAMSRSCGVSPESRPFRPHITMARSKGKSGIDTVRRLSTPALALSGPEIRWHAPEFLLYKSVLLPEGARYDVRARFPLASEASGTRER